MPGTQSHTRTLASILIECGIVTEAQVDAALARQRETGRFIGESLVELGFTSEENIGWALSKQLGIPYADVQPRALDPELVRRFPESLLRRVQAVPLFGTSEEITVAMADPGDADAVAELASAAGTTVTLVIGGPGSIRRALDALYGHPSPAPREGAAHRGTNPVEAPAAVEGSVHDVVWDRAGTNFLLFHLYTARQKSASEIHFLPADGRLGVYYRTDRGLEPQAPERIEAALYLRARLAVLGAPDLPADGSRFASGSLRIEVGTRAVAVGVSHCLGASGVATVLRLSPALDDAPDLSALGLSPIGEAEIRELAEGPEGLVIIYGPPRAGGSTMLSSLVGLAARDDRRVLALEPSHLAPYPPRTTRVAFQRPEEVMDLWQPMTIDQGADIVALDGVLRGETIDRILAPVSVGRLLFARTDWLDGEALLSYLARTRGGCAVLRDRPFALIGLPTARIEGASVWTQSEDADRRAGSVEVRLLSDEDRDALQRGALL